MLSLDGLPAYPTIRGLFHGVRPGGQHACCAIGLLLEAAVNAGIFERQMVLGQPQTWRKEAVEARYGYRRAGLPPDENSYHWLDDEDMEALGLTSSGRSALMGWTDSVPAKTFPWMASQIRADYSAFFFRPV
jgi:hypothetical protein